MYFVGIYARLSVDSGERKNESIDTQIEIAMEYMRRQDDMILYDCYTDLGRTGTTFDRRGFERMMEDVRLRRVNCVIVKDFSRFGRNYIETGNYLQKIFPFLGVRFIAVTDWYDSLLDRNDEIGINLKNLANEMYTRDIAVKVKSSKRAKWESGSYTGGIPPYGYRAEWTGGRKHLLAEAETAEIVKEIFRFYGGGKSLRETAEWLYGEQIHRPTEYRRYGHTRRQDGEVLLEWGRTSIKMILTNPVYIGCLVQAGPEGRSTLLRQPEDMDSGKCLVKAGTHEALVSREQFFKAAQRFRDKIAFEGSGRALIAGSLPEKGFTEINSPEKNPPEINFSGSLHSGKMEDLFEGILFCGICGKKLGRKAFSRKGFSGRETGDYQYFCNNATRIDQLRCRCEGISGEDLTGIVREAVRRELALAELRPERPAEVNAGLVEERKAALERKSRAIQGKIKRVKVVCSEQYLGYREGVLGRDKFLDEKFRNQRELERLEQELKNLERGARELEAEAARQRLFLENLPKLEERWKPDRELTEVLIKGIRLYPGKRMEILFRFGEGIKRGVLKNQGVSFGQET